MWTQVQAGAVIAATLLALGFLFGGIAVAVHYGPGDFLTNLSKVQGIVAAFIALVATASGYAAATAKVRSDENQAAHARNRKENALRQEMIGKARLLMLHAHEFGAPRMQYTKEEAIDVNRIFFGSIGRARGFTSRAWEEIEHLSIEDHRNFTADLIAFDNALDDADAALRAFQSVHEKGAGKDQKDWNEAKKHLRTIYRHFQNHDTDLKAIAADIEQAQHNIAYARPELNLRPPPR
jgi:hypothetical protein